jgi:hypothetical protein
MIRPLTILAAVVVLAAGCAPATGPGASGARDVWFTNVAGVGSQSYDVGTSPRRVYPEVKSFDKSRDRRVIIVIVLGDGAPHSLRAVLANPVGVPRTIEWKLESMPRVADWRITTASWPTEVMPAGTNSVDLTVDGTPAGTYTFQIR